MTVVGTVASIHRFPLKSMSGESLAEVELDGNGMVGDRTWALRDIETGRLASAKRPRPWAALLECVATGAGDDVEITLPTGEVFHIHDAGLPVALEAYLGRTVAIEESEHAQQGLYDSEWPEVEGVDLSGDIAIPTNVTGEGTTFIDLGILHVLTSASLASLSDADPDLVLDVRRFRPGFVLDTPGFEGFPENDDWAGATLRIGSGDDAVEIEIGDPTPRCIMTTLDQGGLPRQNGLLQTLARINRRVGDMGAFACLGAYATVARPGVVRTGDEISLR